MINLENFLFEEIMSKPMDFFYNSLPSGFESREGQEDISFDIVEAMRDNENIIISTSTIALQEQLVADIKSLFPLLGYSPQIVLAKGMTDFICKEGALRYLDNIKTTKLNLLLDWINEDRSGDKTEMPKKLMKVYGKTLMLIDSNILNLNIIKNTFLLKILFHYFFLMGLKTFTFSISLP